MKQTDLIKYNTLYNNYKVNSLVIIDQFCNSWTAINLGTTAATVNGIPLNAGVPGTNNGESFSIGGNISEIFMGRIDVGFPATGIGNVLIIQKIYLPENFK
jgi:hypothetical protein